MSKKALNELRELQEQLKATFIDFDSARNGYADACIQKDKCWAQYCATGDKLLDLQNRIAVLEGHQ